MKKIRQTIALLLMVSMMAACTTSSRQLREESQQAYPNREWQRPPSHWSPP